ncbi:uncharacterized histidine-rich protein DDB_G0274557 isoform X1 [Eurytemora carolleeae]|uniref:uncharacterized histidine-rich protein DDB_G0274557 isoform X1 n=1 Tax=Eurytemora carolleeae TaxID=1294199 RepID=UPI000C772425|nr:uncharacterized histidine-rich protein DDB_G0274557 isoform X1 [Eurytemora carolleeae]|eukprot:XP_023347651.1 uncharacterized histidine-rich protein DDB_G0274557-like isoform X1 [Eurytemora affinis]
MVLPCFALLFLSLKITEIAGHNPNPYPYYYPSGGNYHQHSSQFNYHYEDHHYKNNYHHDYYDDHHLYGEHQAYSGYYDYNNLSQWGYGREHQCPNRCIWDARSRSCTVYNYWRREYEACYHLSWGR